MMFPMLSWERINLAECNAALTLWGHRIGPCHRPYGHQSFGLFWMGELAAVAHSATLVKNSVYGYARKETVELARLCSDPAHADLTRVCLRLWRKCAQSEWERDYWPATACLSYSRNDWHMGDIYRFDGWGRLCVTRGSKATGGGLSHSKPTAIWPKTIWIWPKPQVPA